jgi:hypothetical protein
MPTNDTLDQILTNYPGLNQSPFAEDAEHIRLTTTLDVVPPYDDRPRELFLLFTQNEFRDVCRRHELERALCRKLAHNAFVDANHHNLIESSVSSDSQGVWRAQTVDGLKWKFDAAQSKWVKSELE